MQNVNRVNEQRDEQGVARRGRGRGRGGRGGRGNGRDAHPRAPPVAVPAVPNVPAMEENQGNAGDRPHVARQRTVEANARAYRLMLPRGLAGAAAVARAESLGFEPVLRQEVRPHPLSHAIRSQATVTTMSHAHHRLRQMSERPAVLVSAFGADRDFGLANWVNDGVAPEEQLRVFVSGQVVTAGDLNRRITPGARADLIETVERASRVGPCALLLVDVYWDWVHGGDRAFTPETVAAYYDITGAEGPVYWVGHRFEGAMGTIEQEGAWVRVFGPDGDSIVSRSDPAAAAYGPHPPLDWLHHRSAIPYGTGSLAWTAIYTVGDTIVYMFERVPMQLMAALQLPPPASMMWATVNTPDLRGPWADAFANYMPTAFWTYEAIWGKFVPRKQVCIHVPLARLMTNWLQGRSYSVHVIKALFNAMRDELSKSDTYRVIALNFPVSLAGVDDGQVFDSILFDTAVYAVVHYAQQNAPSLRAVNLTHGPALAAYNSDLANFAVAPKPASGVLTKGLVAMGFLGLYLLWRWRSKRAAVLANGGLSTWVGQCVSRLGALWTGAKQRVEQALARSPASGALVVSAVVTAPLVEEGVRVLLTGVPASVSSALFVANDAIGARLTGQPFGAHAVVHLYAVHYALAAVNHGMGYWAAVAWHAAHNAVVLYGRGVGDNLASGEDWIWGLFLFALLWLWKLDFVSGPSRWRRFQRQFDSLAAQPGLTAEGRDDPQPVDAKEVEPLTVDGEQNVVAKTIVDPSALVPIREGPVPGSFLEIKSVQGPVVSVAHGSKQLVHYACAVGVAQTSPANTADNLLYAVQQRLLKAPPSPPNEQQIWWRGASATFARRALTATGSVYPPIDREECIDAWWQHIAEQPGKLARMRAAEKEVLETTPKVGDRSLSTVPIMVKTDELLLQRAEVSDGYAAKFKPRTIANLGPVAQYLVGPEVYETAQRIKLALAVEAEGVIRTSYLSNGKAVHAYYLAGATDVELTRFWARAALQPGWHVGAAGDDSIVIGNAVVAGLALVAIEGDASQYDQSQSSGPLQSEYQVFQHYGCPGRIVELLAAFSHADYLVADKTGLWRFKISRKNRPMRDTGGADTTAGNTINMLTFLIGVLEDTFHAGEHWAGLQAAISRHRASGFEIKWKFHDEAHDASFLKGRWWATDRGRVWGPLPSRVLKFGKALTSFPLMFQGPRMSYADAARAFLQNQAKNYASYLQVPLLRAFVRRHAAIPRAALKPKYAAVMRTQPEHALSGVTLDEQAAEEELVKRYRCPAEWLREFEAIARSMPEFCVIWHPLCELMALADYG